MTGMNTLDYATETRHGSIYDTGFEHWWEPDELLGRSVPIPPDELGFEADKRCFVETGFLRLKGWLINETGEEFVVGLFSSPAVFWMEFVDSPGVVERPYDGPVRPPPAPPPPTVLFVPPLTRVEFLAVLELSRYEFEPGSDAAVKWQFNYWNEPRPRGLIKVALP